MLARDLLPDPSVNPAVLDTCTWDPTGAVIACRERKSFLAGIGYAVRAASQVVEAAPEGADPFSVYAPSLVKAASFSFVLAGLLDGQKLFLCFSEAGPPREDWDFEVLDCLSLHSSAWRGCVSLIPADRRNTRAFLRHIAPFLAPRALGPVSRLGIGVRMSSLTWPGVVDALLETGVSANIIQNSVGRELAPLEQLLDPVDIGVIPLPGLGNVQIGHTGSSIEGLWLHGSLYAISRGMGSHAYGADADHIPVKRSDDGSGLDNAKKLTDCARDYTFFTADTSDLFNYPASELGDGEAGCRMKYGDAIQSAAELYGHIAALKSREPFDFEFSMDETPLGLPAQEAVTTPQELVYVLTELQRQGMRPSHVAPNFGVEKGVDYRLDDGLPGLRTRVAEMARMAEDFGVVLDFHSGDDLSSETRCAIAEATGGRLHFKVSPQLQFIYAEVLRDCDHGLFREWWHWTLDHTMEEAESGNQVAARYVGKLDERRLAEGGGFRPLPSDPFFRNYAFASVGKRDGDGKFVHRHQFYSAGSAVETEYRTRIRNYVVELAGSLGLPAAVARL